MLECGGCGQRLYGKPPEFKEWKQVRLVDKSRGDMSEPRFGRDKSSGDESEPRVHYRQMWLCGSCVQHVGELMVRWQNGKFEAIPAEKAG